MHLHVRATVIDCIYTSIVLNVMHTILYIIIRMTMTGSDDYIMHNYPILCIIIIIHNYIINIYSASCNMYIHTHL